MSMDTSYIQESVSAVLAEGLRETIKASPVDPVDYLAKWLLHYRDLQDNLSQFSSDQVNLEAKKEEYINQLQKEKEQMDAERLKKEEEEKRKALEKQKKKERKERSKNSNEEEEESAESEAPQSQTEGNSETVYSSSYD